MRIDIISAVPELLKSPLMNSIPARAQEKGKLELYIHNLHDYGIGKYRQIDDYPFGGGAGMVLKPEPFAEIIENLLSEREYDEIIFTSPDGKLFTQSSANQLSLKGNLMFLCGHYKGIDHRIREQYVTMELSLGDFVLTGGEIAVSAMVDAIVRLIPGVIGNEESALSDSFQDDLLAPPVFTRPENFKGKKVPEILLSGNHKKIEEWRMEQALQRTQALRPDLIKKEE
ncbi:tRNA (guanosine(37)-N1)-methyltransferase TrmD [Bacteroidia bacterium]|nr:tRNA (guanosine(37)-N1)-methyltransferase TrmD [Bacteroidia bacterium]